MVTDSPVDLLFEREGELAMLRRAAGRAVGGAGRLLLVEGAAGIGKTSLLDRAAQEAGRLGADVLRARGGELEREFSYGVARQLLERPVVTLPAAARETVLAGAAVHAAPALGLTVNAGAGELDEPSLTDRGFSVPHGLYWLVANLAEERPLALLVDDLQWADVASLRFVVHLVRRLEGLPVLVCAAVRTAERGADDPALAALAGDPLTEVIRPSPVSEAAVGAWLAAARDSEPEAGLTRACHRVTGGNPFLVGELVGTLRATGGWSGGDAVARVGELGPRTVARSILLRLGGESTEAAALARAVALLGTEVKLAHAAALAGLGVQAAAEAADRLAAVDILRAGRPLEFVHPIVRTAIHAELPAAELARGHARAAALLIGEGTDPERIAVHLLATDPAGEPDTVTRMFGAAQVALERGAPESAARFLRRALAEPPPHDERAGVEGALGVAELRAGRIGPAVGHLRAAIGGELVGPARALWGLALAYAAVALGDIVGAVDVLERAIEDARGGEPELAGRLEAEFAVAYLDPQAISRVAPRLERHASLRGDTPGERLLLAACARSLALRERPVACAVAIARRAVDRGLLQDPGVDESHAAYGALWTLVLGEELDEAQRLLSAGIARAQAVGSSLSFAGASLLRALARLAAGSVLGAEADARAALAALDEPHAAAGPAALAALVEALVEQGRLDEAAEALASSHEEIDASHSTPVNRLRHSRAMLHLAAGRHELALADAVETGRREELDGFISPLVPWRQVAALALRRLNRCDEAFELAQRQAAIARAYGTASLIGGALRLAALVGDREARAQRLEEAVELLAGSPARLEHARALVDLAIARSRAGRRADARVVLEDGLERAHRCGAFALAGRAHEGLLALGARPRRRAFSGFEALTASERRVTTLAAHGHTNREIAQSLFVTTKTVENHLGRAYHKLGIHSRDELAGVLGASEGGDLGVGAPQR